MNEDVETTALTKTDDATLTEPDPAKEVLIPSSPPFLHNMVVLGRDKEEIAEGQGQLLQWFEAKVLELKGTVSDAEGNLATAEKNTWKLDPFKRQLRKARKELIFFEKGTEAIRAGYWLVPNFPLEIFAVRTSKKNPPPGWKRFEFDTRVASDGSAVGEGKYVSPEPYLHTKNDKYQGKDGNTYNRTLYAADGHDEAPLFPFSLVKPEVLTATSVAKAKMIFDELGTMRQDVKGRDPVIAGRISMREGALAKTLTFLICWFIDSKAL